MNIDILIVGAGFAGAVVAEQLANSGFGILLIDRRTHIGGNAYDEYDRHGVLIHRYGPHIFHTNSERIFNYLSKFTNWHNYEHRVLASVSGTLYPLPINANTLNMIYNLSLDESGVIAFLEQARQNIPFPANAEETVLATVGRDLYEKFFLNYTRKQWGLAPRDLSASVTARIPVRTNFDNRYFTDRFQGMPIDGYTALFKNLLDHPKIQLELDCDFTEITNTHKFKHIVFTGPIDSYFKYCYGRLPYRSLHFEHIHFPDIEYLQPAGTINYPNDHDYTRITEFKHLTGQIHSGTSIVREYPNTTGDPYYPVPTPANDILYKQYALLAANEANVSFVGRLAQYRYFNMDQVVGAAITHARRIAENYGHPTP